MRVWTYWDLIHMSEYKLQTRSNHQFISVIVIGRNEEDTISDCLKSIANNHYPPDQFEIIFVDDHSDDQTVLRARHLEISQLRILHLSETDQSKHTNSFKKLGIQYALQHAKGEIIVSTDADCTVPKNWLGYIDFGMQQALIKMLVMPIRFTEKKSILNRFQSLDMMATMVFTGFGIHSRQFYSANGANIAFRKKIYKNIDLREDYASGDDMFLVQAMSQDYPEGVRYIKAIDLIVNTKAESSWTALFQQRKRWATKSKGYVDKRLVKLQAGVFLFNAMIVTNLVLGLTLNSFFLFIAGFQLLIKGIMDYLLLSNVAEFFNQNESLKLFLLSFFMFTPYMMLMGFWALIGGSYIWKGRKVE